MKPCVQHSRRAFTLLEVLLAITIFSLVVMTIYAVWMMVLRATKSGQYAAAEAQRERIAMRTIEEALSCVQSFGESIQYYSFVADNDDQVLSFVARLPSSFPRSGRFGDLTTRRVSFSVEPGPESSQLVLRQAPIVMDFDEDEMKRPLVLAKNVGELSFEFWDPRQNDWVDEWRQTNQLPKLIKVNLQLNAAGHHGSYSTATAGDREVSRIVALPSMTVPGLFQYGAPQQGGPQPGPGGLPPGGVPPGVPPPGGRSLQPRPMTQ